MSANIRETRFCMGVHKQAALQTPLEAADMISLYKTNPSLFQVDLRTESNAGWIGKNDEFPTQNFLTSWDASGALEGYLSSEKAALLLSYAHGKSTATPLSAGAISYAIEPLDPVTEEIEMPSTTFVEAIRQGASSVIDRALVGMCCEEVAVDINSGPGLQGARITSQWVGCGKTVEPSTITVPAITAEHLLPAYSATLSVIGMDYVTAGKIATAHYGWKNNIRLDTGYYPGSGSSDGAQVRGRMEHGDRAVSFSAVARYASDSTELAKLKAQTEGTVVLTLTGALIAPGIYHSLTITLQRVVIRTAQISDTDGIVTVAVEVEPLTHSVNGLVDITVVTATDEIMEAAA